MDTATTAPWETDCRTCQHLRWGCVCYVDPDEPEFCSPPAVAYCAYHEEHGGEGPAVEMAGNLIG